jgi:two-component system sensor histidine kinase BarA
MSLNRLLMALAGIPLIVYAVLAVLLVVYGNVQPRGQWIVMSGLGGVLLGSVLAPLALAINRRVTRELALARHGALRANAVKSEFLASMSHEIRTPLNGIIGFCRLLGRSRLDTRQQEWLQHVHHACDNLLLLVNDVLDFSRLEANRLTLEDTALDMVTLVDEAIGLHAPDSQRKQLHLLAMVYDDVPTPVRGDPLRIQQVLNNLIGNALKFTHTGGVIVRVMLDEQADDERQQRRVLRLSVSDTGIGLSHAQQARLFQAFTQAEPSHAREFGGSGLGLTICRQLVQQMGGKISVDSLPDGGSTFAVTLPLLAPDAAERPVEISLPEGSFITLHEPHAPTHFALAHLIERWGGRINAANAPALKTAPPADRQLCLIALTQADLNAERRAGWQAYIHAAGCPTLVLANATGLDAATFTFPHGGELLGKPCGRDALAAALKRLLVSTPMHQAQPPGFPAPVAAPVRQLLIVDDNASNRQLLKVLLESERFQTRLQVSTAPSGHTALHMARYAQRPFDMVLMDIRMPDMSGIQTTQALRRLSSRWARCPIIAVTAHALSHERRQWLTEGFDDVLIKPVDVEQLQALLQRFPGTRPAAHEQPSALEDTSAAVKPLAVTDLALGRKLAGGNAVRARRQLIALIESLGQSEREMYQARRQGDEKALLDAVHCLHGASRYCGAPELALRVESLETQLRTRGMDHADSLLEGLYQAMARLHAAKPQLVSV